MFFIKGVFKSPTYYEGVTDHPVNQLMFTAPKNSFKDLFHWLEEQCSTQTILVVVSTFKVIWYVRNQKIFEGSSPYLKATTANFATVYTITAAMLLMFIQT